jgi:hypothetical protein
LGGKLWGNILGDNFEGKFWGKIFWAVLRKLYKKFFGQILGQFWAILWLFYKKFIGQIFRTVFRAIFCLLVSRFAIHFNNVYPFLILPPL